MDLELVSEHILQMIVDFNVCVIIDPKQIQHDVPGRHLLDSHYVIKPIKMKCICISRVEMLVYLEACVKSLCHCPCPPLLSLERIGTKGF